MEYKLSLHITESCCRVSATYVELSSRKIERRDIRERSEWERDQQELEGDRLVKWNKVKEEACVEWQWVKKWKSCERAEGKVHRKTKHRHPEYHQKWIIFRKKNLHLSSDNIRVVGHVEAAVINSREWHHGVCQRAGVGILLTVKPENKLLALTSR